MRGISAIIRLTFGLAALGSLRAEPSTPAPALLVDGDALPRKWSPPVCPASVSLTPGAPLEVDVRFVVDATGQVASARVLRSPDARLNEAAVACVRTWRFTPALEQSKPAPCCLDVTVEFAAPSKKAPPRPGMEPLPLPRPVPLTVAEAGDEPPGDYPASFDQRKIPGRVIFACHVDETGGISAARALSATHPDFVQPALLALRSWKFQPAHRGDLPVASEVRGEMDFDLSGSSRAEMLAASGITAPDGTPPADEPEPLVVADPVWPYQALIAAKAGAATVIFTVNESGYVEKISVRDATQPEFGRALAAAIEAWRFRPAGRGGSTIAVALTQHVEFKAEPPEVAAEPGDPLPRLLAAIQAGTVGSPAGLDQPLTPVFRVSPHYPAVLRQGGRPAGTAVIEIVIARDGRARLPRIVSASQEEFGWSAATALAQWIFLPPLRHGAPVDVRVQVPVKFAPPAG